MFVMMLMKMVGGTEGRREREVGGRDGKGNREGRDKGGRKRRGGRRGRVKG